MPHQNDVSHALYSIKIGPQQKVSWNMNSSLKMKLEFIGLSENVKKVSQHCKFLVST